MSDAQARLAPGQGAFHGATGVPPLVHVPGPEATAGPETGRRLVGTVGVRVAGAGGTLAPGAPRRGPPREEGA